jgi:hypothetical protein
VEIVYELQLLLNNTFTQTGRGAKCLLDIHHWNASLAVTGRPSDIGQKVLKSYFQSVSSSSSPSYSQIFFRIAFL